MTRFDQFQHLQFIGWQGAFCSTGRRLARSTITDQVVDKAKETAEKVVDKVKDVLSRDK